jgi:conjugal transfer pilus assembly protein TraV
MEAWIAPWEDATGDLYPPSTVYIEVDPERWQYGGASDGRLTVLRPLQVEQRSAPEVTAPGTVLPPSPVSADSETAPFFAPQSAKRGA